MMSMLKRAAPRPALVVLRQLMTRDDFRRYQFHRRLGWGCVALLAYCVAEGTWACLNSGLPHSYEVQGAVVLGVTLSSLAVGLFAAYRKAQGHLLRPYA
jgi:hypothetical protein